MAKIKVSSIGMREKSKTMNDSAKKIAAIVEGLIKDVQSIKGVWEGQTSEAMVQQFLKFKAGFEERHKTIQGYAKFLNGVADVWDKVESSTKKAFDSKGK